MLTGIASILMSSGPPPDTQVGEGDKEKLSKHGLDELPADAGLADRMSLVHGDSHGAPVIAAAFGFRDGGCDMLNTSTNSNSCKRQADVNDESSIPSKRSKFETTGCDVVFRGWGPNGNAINVSDSGLSANQNFIGSLLSNQMTQNSFLSNSSAPSAASFPDATSFSLGNEGLPSILYRDQVTRDRTINAMLLAKLVASNEQLGAMGSSAPFLNSSQNLLQLQQRLRPLGGWGNSYQQPGILTASPVELQQIANMQSLSQLNQRLYGNVGPPLSMPGYRSLPNENNQANSSQEQFSARPRGCPSILNGNDQGSSSAEQLSALFRQIYGTNGGNQQSIMNAPAPGNVNFALNITNRELSLFQVPQEQPSLLQRSILDLPSCDEGQIESHLTRPFFPLGIPEDPNWLSEFHCFVRSHLVEVFRAGYDDVKIRNNSIVYQQVGIRCRFCANMPHGVRSGRASAFPSSLRQIYQSFTMMLRDHFVSCEAIPSSTLEEFTALKNKPAQGATDSKRYWIYSAKKIGMIDSPDGIVINQKSRTEGIDVPSFGTVSGQTWEDEAFHGASLVRPGDRELVAEFLLVLLSQVQPIRLTEAECIGNRRSLRVGLPGFGCRFCCEHKRLGLCRMFPARRRTLPNKVNDLYDHLRRCILCPQSIKDSLEDAKRRLTTSFQSDQAGDREFFDRVWSRMGHTAGSDST
jgi:hypothetical protein